MPLPVGTRLTITIALSIVLLGIAGALALERVDELVRQERWISHTYQVDAALARFDADLNGLTTGAIPAAELSVRADSLRRLLSHLRLLTLDNQHQQRRIARMALLVDERIATLAHPTSPAHLDPRDLDDLGAIRAISRAIDQEERTLLAARRADTVRSRQRAIRLVATLIIFGLLSTAVSAASLIKESRLRRTARLAFERSETQYRRAEEERQSREELEQRVDERTSELSRIVAALQTEIAERERAEAALRDAKETAESASRAKSDFLARMSHELRTPLNSIIGFSNVLLKNRSGSLAPQDLAYLHRIADNGTHLLGLINQVLDLAKIEAGRLELNLASVALERVIYETMEELEGRFVDTKVVPRVALPLSMEPIDADAGKLKQVLINLIGNAVKFTERGSVTVRVTADPTTSRPVRIDVIDTGIGIPVNRQSAIFERFEQADATTARRYGGTGLGLAISRSLCELMGYRLQLESTPGVGSTFSIVMPHLAHAPRTVMVVEHDDGARARLTTCLRALGVYELHLTTSIQGAGERLRLATPHLIIADAHLPAGGSAALEAMLRRDPRFGTLPVITVEAGALDDVALEQLKQRVYTLLDPPKQSAAAA